MNILVVGNTNSQTEFKAKFGANHPGIFKSYQQLKIEDIKFAEIIFDFQLTPESKHGQLYKEHKEAILVLNSVKTTLNNLAEVFHWENQTIGFNGLNGMVNRPLLELTTTAGSHDIVREICKHLNTDYRVVADKVGMVTPRVVCMIINEAFFTVEDGTASKRDINLAMKLGTNYPEGPFEMLNTIGVADVYELLEALRLETGDTRYQICPMLEALYRVKS